MLKWIPALLDCEKGESVRVKLSNLLKGAQLIIKRYKKPVKLVTSPGMEDQQ